MYAEYAQLQLTFLALNPWLQLSHGPATLCNQLNYYTTLSYLSVGRFAFYVIQRNDLQQRLLFNTDGWNARSKQDVLCRLAISVASLEQGLG